MSEAYLRVDSVVLAVCERLGVSWDCIAGKRRTRAASLPRMALGHLLRKRTPMAFTDIGNMVGGRHYSTAIYWSQRCTAEMDRNPSWRATVEAVEKRAEEIEEENDG